MDPGRGEGGVFQLLRRRARACARGRPAAGHVIYVDIRHAHDREDFLAEVVARRFASEKLTADGGAFAGGLKDLSWLSAKGWWSFSRRASTSARARARGGGSAGRHGRGRRALDGQGNPSGPDRRAGWMESGGRTCRPA